ncbi:MAG: cupin domain-containing protein [bacterium]|nr:cupin domain-containing protein [bacterium]
MNIQILSLPKEEVGYLPILRPPVSQKLHSGYVTLAPSQAGDRHSTETYEEMIVVLQGLGELCLEHSTIELSALQIAYVPPHTTHWVRNRGEVPLHYLYIVTQVIEE